MTTHDYNKTVLRFPREIKLQTLRDALEQDRPGVFIELAKILLDAPIKEGGIETEHIDSIWKEYYPTQSAMMIVKEEDSIFQPTIKLVPRTTAKGRRKHTRS